VRRRDLLVGFGAVVARPFVARGQSMHPLPGRRAAVVIGVDKATDLQPLKAAASGARLMEKWFRDHGFTVETLIDDSGPVRAFAVQSAIEKLIKPGALDQLVIYFAGHGFLNARSEVWLLSGAPVNSSEAINVEASVYDARESGITNVGFISDACRSKPDSIRAGKVQGYVVFPNLPTSINSRPDVDRFFAALPGKESFEVDVSVSAPKWEGLYTQALLDAFVNPTTSCMVHTVDGLKVVTNKQLKRHLASEVPKRALAKSVVLNQIPDAIIESETYMGSIDPGAQLPQTSICVAEQPETFHQVATWELKNKGLDTLSGNVELLPPTATVRFQPFGVNEFFQAQARVQEARSPASFETGSGINVIGTEIEAAVPNRRMKVDVLRIARISSPAVRVYLDGAPAGSVALRFADGGGTIVAALAEFVATVIVEQGRVINVTYVPVITSPRWQEYGPQSQRLQSLRATVAASARF
jgi:hypothetical protein